MNCVLECAKNLPGVQGIGKGALWHTVVSFVAALPQVGGLVEQWGGVRGANQDVPCAQPC